RVPWYTGISPLPRCPSAEKVQRALALPALTDPESDPNAQCAPASRWYSPPMPRTPALKSCSHVSEPPAPPLAPVSVEPSALKTRLSLEGAEGAAGGTAAESTASAACGESQAAAMAASD